MELIISLYTCRVGLQFLWTVQLTPNTQPGLQTVHYVAIWNGIRDSSQISTTALIFLLSNHFRQKYLEIASCAVSLLNNIWIRVEHSQCRIDPVSIQAHRELHNILIGL